MRLNLKLKNKVMKTKINIPQIETEPHPISLERVLPKQLIELNFSFDVITRSFLCRKKEPKGIYTLSVIELDYGDLILQQGREKDFVTVLHKDYRGASIQITPSGQNTPFILILDPSVIVDFRKNLADVAINDCCTNVTFRVKLTPEGKTEGLTTELISIPVIIEAPRPAVCVDVEFDSIVNDLVYDATVKEPFRIGDLVLKHSMVNNCAPELTTNFTFESQCEDRVLKNLISLDTDCIKESRPCNQEGEVVVQNHALSVLAYNHDILPGNVIKHRLEHIRGCNPSNIIRIPIMFDMSKISNPLDAEQPYQMKLVGDYSYSLGGERNIGNIGFSKSIVVKKDPKQNGLKVTCIDHIHDDKEVLIENLGRFDWGKLSLIPTYSNICTIQISNEALAIDPVMPTANVVVWNYRVKQLHCDKSRIVMRKPLLPKEYFTLKCYNEDDIDVKNNVYRFFPLESGQLNSLMLDLNINGSDIIEIKRAEDGSFTTPMSLEFEFDYALAVDDETPIEALEKRHFSATILWRMEQIANPEWLSVDMGTSAIVASFAKSFDADRNPIIDLKANKNLLLARTYRDKPEKKEDKTPEKAPFIPSVISFNSTSNAGEFNKERKDEDFKDYSVWLSPSTSTKDIILPCLKTLVGYKTLPNILTEGERKNFKYVVDGEETTLFDEKGNVVEKGLAYVNTILEEVYKQLFRHYICIESRDAANPNPIRPNELHKLVLSVPNTFTPKHYQLLKSIAHSMFPSLRPEYLQIVSESDAVACYYLHNRSRFYEGASESVRDRKSELDKKEHILVYDMGAGTLDLTYFVQRRTPDGVVKVDMQGKIGVNKAGNYLDYLLGDILCDLLETRETDTKPAKINDLRRFLEFDKNSRIKAGTSKQECEDFKDYLKDKIKPLLNNRLAPIPDYEGCVFRKGENILTINDICTHKKYLQYIKECTNEVIDSLVKLLSKQSSEAMFGDVSFGLPIDVLVFSGRSTALYDIRKSVAQYIIDNSQNGKNALCADLVTEKLVSIEEILNISENKAIDGSKLKSVVTYGSLIYADWINRPSYFKFEGNKIFANYGLLVKDVTDEGDNAGWNWYPLITNKNTPLPQTKNIFSDYIEFKGSAAFSLERTREIIFVQSYSKNPAADWRRGIKDMITEITHFDVPNGRTGDANISIEIYKSNTIICKISGFGEVSMEPHDDFQNESLRKSLWPVAF